MNSRISESLFDRALKVIPGGVNSPVRAFRSVGGVPVFIRRAEGVRLFDADGNSYIDLINSWGPMILGHAHPEVVSSVAESLADSFSFGAPGEREVNMAELICSMVPSVEKVRMVNSGTEAAMSAIRVARGFTGKNKILKFAGCYHGHGDSFLIAAGSGAMTFGIPDSKGVTEGVAKDTLTAAFNDLEEVEKIIRSNRGEIAAVILEPVVGNMGLVNPEEGFLQGLRELCSHNEILLVFDEVMTGFRLAPGGAQQKYGVQPDLTVFGKIIGGGMPVGAYGGRGDIMDMVAPAGPVYQAGTLSGNPVALAAGLATLKILKRKESIYGELDEKGQRLESGLREIFRKAGETVTINRNGSMFTLFFTAGPVNNLSDAKKCDTGKFASFFQCMLKRGVYMAPSQFEAMFLSAALTTEDVDFIIRSAAESLKEMAGTEPKKAP